MSSFLDALLPPACSGCGRMGAVLCARCRGGFRAAHDPGTAFAGPDTSVVIGDALILGIAAFAHAGPARRALAAVKYLGTSRVAPELAALAAPALRRLLLVSGRATLVPVPIHRDRFADRGYNQAALIAGALARESGLSMKECLRRVRPTTKQHHLSRSARLANLRGAFTPLGKAPGVVILVDDIVTTTATLEACAAVLREAGSGAVYALAVAREI